MGRYSPGRAAGGSGKPHLAQGDHGNHQTAQRSHPEEYIVVNAVIIGAILREINGSSVSFLPPFELNKSTVGAYIQPLDLKFIGSVGRSITTKFNGISEGYFENDLANESLLA